jgi:predicted regulator of Ras-like GTPase activity (Roadblock/LC7/MglB family)
MFREKIQKMVDRLDGAVGGVLMGFDGIAVDSYVREAGAIKPDIQTIGVEIAHLVAQARRGADSLEMGPLGELTMRTDRLTVLVRVLNKDYFVACAFDAAGSVGKARYLLRLVVPQIEAEL